jgi:hypothetical protein
MKRCKHIVKEQHEAKGVTVTSQFSCIKMDSSVAHCIDFSIDLKCFLCF